MTMTVKELIAELKKHPEDSSVLISVCGLKNSGYELVSDGEKYDPEYVDLAVQEVFRGCNGKTVYIGEVVEEE